MVLGQPEWKQYEPVKTPTTITSGPSLSMGRSLSQLIYPPDPIRAPSKPLTAGETLRSRAPKTTYTYKTSPDINDGNGGVSIDRSAYFSAGKYAVYGDLPEYYKPHVHELPASREQFVSEGGVFGEPVAGIDEAITEEGLFGEGEGKPLFNLKLIGLLVVVFIFCLLIFAL